MKLRQKFHSWKQSAVEKAAKGKSALSRKGQLSIGDIGPIALSLGVAVIIISVVSMILSNMQQNVNETTETEAYDVLTKGLDAMSTFGDWFNIIVIVAVAAIILGLVLLFRGTFSGGKARA